MTQHLCDIKWGFVIGSKNFVPQPKVLIAVHKCRLHTEGKVAQGFIEHQSDWPIRTVMYKDHLQYTKTTWSKLLSILLYQDEIPPPPPTSLFKCQPWSDV